MKRNFVLFLAVVALLFVLAGCGAPHSKYRGQENSPFQRITPLGVDPNQIQNMSAQEFDEYMRRLRTYNEYVRDTAYSNAYSGYGEKQWENDPEGGPPAPPSLEGGTGAGASRRSGGGRQERTIGGEAARTAKDETSNIIRGTMRDTSSELQRTIREEIRNIFR